MAGKFYPAKKYKWINFPLGFIKQMLLGRRSNEKDNIVLVTGARGDGKSTFVGKILFQFEDFVPYESMIFSKEKMFELVKKKNGFIWADEAVVNAAKGNVMTRANKMLHEIFTINRDNFNIVFFCMPFIEDFDSKILQYCSMWVHIDSRGLGVILLPSNKGLFGKRRWDIDAMKKMFDEFLRENSTSVHVPYWIFPNFRGYCRFAKLSAKQDKIMKEIKALRKNENMEKEMQEVIISEVKSSDDYLRYSTKKLGEMVGKGEIRTIIEFNDSCKELKINQEIALSRVDKILKLSGVKKTTKQLFKEYDRIDNMIKF